MDARNNALLVTVCTAIGAITVLLGYVGYRNFRGPTTDLQIPAVVQQDLSGRRHRPRIEDTAAYLLSQRRKPVEETLRKLDELQRLLEKKTDLLQEKEALLTKRTAECDALKKEADQYLGLMFDVLSANSYPRPSLAHSEDEKRVAASRAELERLTDGLSQGELLDDELESELVAIRRELDQANAELVEAEVSALLSTHDLVQSRADNALIATGTAAVPYLVAALTDEQATVRKWAADLLGRMGADAVPAVDMLLIVAEDKDQNVREAALDALARIDDEI